MITIEAANVRRLRLTLPSLDTVELHVKLRERVLYCAGLGYAPVEVSFIDAKLDLTRSAAGDVAVAFPFGSPAELGVSLRELLEGLLADALVVTPDWSKRPDVDPALEKAAASMANHRLQRLLRKPFWVVRRIEA